MGMISLVNNVPAFAAARAQTGTLDEITKASRRLATGLRINSAADDASGLALATGFDAAIQGLREAMNAILTGVSLLQTGEGGLMEYSNILIRLRALAIRSLTGTLTNNERQLIQKEVDQLLLELKQITETTKFNEISLLNRGTVTKGPPKVVSIQDLQQITFGNLDTLADISQNGLRIVFSRGPAGAENIFIKDLPAGAEVQLTPAGTGRNRQANFSPDGSKIVFSSNRITAGNPTGDREIFVMNTDGSGVTQLTSNTFDDSQPTFSPDGTRIAYATGLFTADALQDIATIDATLGDAGGVTQVTTSSDFNYFPRFTPDGTRIVYTSNFPPLPTGALHINTIPVGGGAATPIAFDTLQMEGPAVSPDGQFVFFRKAEDSGLPFNFGLYVTNVDGSSLSNFPRLFDFASPADEGRPSVSKDTARVVFHSNTGGSGDNIWGFLPEIQNTFFIKGDLIPILTGYSVGNIKEIELTNVSPEKIGLGTLDLSTRVGALLAVPALNAALDTVVAERGKFGAQQNVLEGVFRNVMEGDVAFTAAMSRVQDADVAKEAARLAKAQILLEFQQATQAQANLIPESLLQIISSTGNQGRIVGNQQAR